MANSTLWRSMRSYFHQIVSIASESTSKILNWLALGLRYLRYLTILRGNLTYWGSIFIWFMVKNLALLTGSLSDSAVSLIRFLFLVCERAAYLAALILVICLWKSIRPRYKLYERKSLGEKTSVNELDTQKTPKTAELIDCDTNKWLLIRGLKSHYLDSQRECHNSLALSDIGQIHENISWSHSRFEFESVNWFNRSAQILWPSIKTIVTKGIAAAMKKESASSRKHLIKSKEQVKLSVYLSCRRRLKLMRNRRNKILRKGDEFLGQKLIIMILYFSRKLAILLKQYLMDHLRGLISLSMRQQEEDRITSMESREIDVDVAEMLKKSDIVYRSKLGGNQASQNGSVGSKARKLYSRTASRSKGLSGSKRIMSGGLISAAQLQKFRDQREELVQRANQAYVAAKESRDAKKIVLEHLDLGDSAPRLTAIKYLDEDESTKSLATMMCKHDTRIAASTSKMMRLLIEVDFSSGNHFSARLNSVPVLGQVELTRLSFRARILLSTNHDIFANSARNLDIRDAPDEGHLSPILNYLQLSLVDVPQLDWRIKRPKKIVSKSYARRRLRKSKFSRKMESNTVKSMLNRARRTLQPINFINQAYMKYLVHSLLSFTQHWLQPFDILVGDRVRLRTLI